jgi:hypothetical protein
MLALYRKELRGLFPMLVLSMFLVSGDLISRPITERLDEDTFSDVAGLMPGDGTFLAFILWIIAFMVAFAAMPREHDEGTIEFLYALPVTRRGIFLAKAMAGLTTLAITCAMGQVTNAIIVSWNPTSFDGEQLSLTLAARAALVHFLAAAVAYGHGLFASFFRRFGLIPYALAGYVMVVVQEIAPELSWLNPLQLGRFDYVGRLLVIPTGDALFHLGVSGFAAFLAYVLWMGRWEGVRNAFAQRSLGLTLGFGCAMVLLFVVGFFVMGFWAVSEYGDHPPEDPSQPPSTAERSFTTSTAHTEHYTFVYPDNLHDEAMRLITRADRVLASATSVMAEPRTPSITVDLAEVSSHHEGIAAGERIRLGLVEQPSWRLVHVLAHESTHVLQGQASATRLMEHGETTRYFVEGTAEWVAFEVTTAPDTVMTEDELREERELRALSRLVAVTSWERHQIGFDDLFSNTTMTSRWDTTLAYPLGETLGEAISRACGHDGVGHLAQSFARPDMPQDATHETLMRDALASFACDYERVGSAWDALLAETAAAERARIDAIPRLSGGVVESDESETIVEATLDRAPLPHEHYSVRVRADASTPDTEVRGVTGEIVEGSEPRRVRFRIPRGNVRGTHFEILFSVVVDERAFPYSEAWQGASLR